MKIIKALLLVLGVLVLAAGGLVGYLTLTEYRPDDIEQLEVTQAARSDNVRVGERLDVLSFNTGYCGLGRDQDFFMDGGTMVRPESEQIVRDNMNGILSELARQDADIYLLQEVDFDSYRSYYVNQADTYRHGLSLNMAVAYNYKCDFVPFPWPPLGKVESGLVTFTDLNVTQATRESLPVPFTWPMRVANLKRCLLVERVPVEGTEKELVIINLHLEAYDDGEGKRAQTRAADADHRRRIPQWQLCHSRRRFQPDLRGRGHLPRAGRKHLAAGKALQQRASRRVQLCL